MNYHYGPIVKHLSNVAIHGTHRNFFHVINAPAYHFGSSCISTPYTNCSRKDQWDLKMCTHIKLLLMKKYLFPLWRIDIVVMYILVRPLFLFQLYICISNYFVIILSNNASRTEYQTQVMFYFSIDFVFQFIQKT